MRRGMATFVVAAAAAVPVGCGGDDVARAVDPVAEAADKTVAAGGARLEGTGEFRVHGYRIPVTLRGGVDFEERRAHLAIDVRPNKVLKGAEATEAGFPMEYLADAGETIYFATADMRAKLPPGKQWAKVELDELDDDTGLAFQQLNRFDESNPSEWMRLLRTSGGARKLGSERLAGVATTHYKATIDPRRFPDTVAESERAKARETVKRLDELDPSYLDPTPVDVWVDGDGLIRRERIALDEESEGVRTRGELTIDFVDFDRGLDVALPDGGETIDVTDAMARQLKG